VNAKDSVNKDSIGKENIEKESIENESIENEGMGNESMGNPEEDKISEIRENGEQGCCCCKKTVRSEEERRKLINRLNRIEGQIRGIRGMLERDAYCNDILIQSAAVNAAVNSFNKELLSSHIHSCVVRDIRDGRDEVVDELVTTIQKLMR